MKERSLVMAVLATVAFGVYGVARSYSPVLIAYVVEETLVQKAPEGVNATVVHERFRTFLELYPDTPARLERLLAISQYLEKVRKLAPGEMERLFPTKRDPR